MTLSSLFSSLHFWGCPKTPFHFHTIFGVTWGETSPPWCSRFRFLTILSFAPQLPIRCPNKNPPALSVGLLSHPFLRLWLTDHSVYSRSRGLENSDPFSKGRRFSLYVHHPRLCPPLPAICNFRFLHLKIPFPPFFSLGTSSKPPITVSPWSTAPQPYKLLTTHDKLTTFSPYFLVRSSTLFHPR